MNNQTEQKNTKEESRYVYEVGPRNIPSRPRLGKKTRCYTDNEVMERFAPYIKAQGVALYMAINRYSNSVSQKCHPSLKTLMKNSGIGNGNTLQTYLRKLEKYWLIEITSNKKIRKSNEYRMLDVSYGLTRLPTSIKNDNKQYQNCLVPSSKSDTGIQISKSDKEQEEDLSKLRGIESLKEKMAEISPRFAQKYPQKELNDLPEKTLPKAYNPTPSSENIVEQLEPNIAINEGLDADTPPLI